MSEDYFNDAPPADDPASDFFSGGSPSCKFNNVGDAHAGTIVSFEIGQQRDIKTGEPKFWPDGNKCEMLVITLQTNERSDEIDDDDGQRRLYVNKPSGMFAAIKQALGKNKMAAGAHLAVKYVKNGKAKQAGFNPPKEYIAKYAPSGNGHQPAADGNAAGGKSPEMIAAWKALCLKSPGMEQDGRKAAFTRATVDLFGDTPLTDITPDQWRNVEKVIRESWTPENSIPLKLRHRPVMDNPISQEPEFADQDIPF